jgi:hypothetical protein
MRQARDSEQEHGRAEDEWLHRYPCSAICMTISRCLRQYPPEDEKGNVEAKTK